MRSQLKLAILESGVPQYRLAADIKCNPSHLSNIVRGKYEPDGLEKELIAQRLGRPVQELFPKKATV